jgi:hypothetical protein
MFNARKIRFKTFRYFGKLRSNFYQNPDPHWIRIRIRLKCWIRIRIRIRI